MPARIPRPHDPVGASVEPSKTLRAGAGLLLPEKPAEKAQGRTKTVNLGLLDGRKPVFVGIDQSLTAFGVAGYSPQDKSAFLWVYRCDLRGVGRLLDLKFFLKGCIQQMTLRCGEPKHVVMEGYAFSRQMGHALGECGATTKIGLIEALGYANITAYPTIPTTQQVKKFCTSNGNAKKSEILKGCLKNWGVDLPDENMADAYVMAQMAAGLGGYAPEFKYQQEVLDRLEKHAEWPDSLERDASTVSG